MEGEIAGTSQSKVLTNTSSLLLIALFVLVLASVLKPGDGGVGKKGGDFPQAKLWSAPSPWQPRVAGLRPVGSPEGPGGPAQQTCGGARRREC